MHEPISVNGAPATWEGMDVSYAEWAAGTDLTPLFKGLPDDKCPCRHWGYILSGSVHLEYTDGTRETVGAGDAFYFPPGHAVWTDEDAALVLFAPNKEHTEVIEHAERVLSQQTE